MEAIQQEYMDSKLNPDKTKKITFGESEIEQVEFTKFLGIIL